MPWWACGVQRAAGGSQFSPPRLNPGHQPGWAMTPLPAEPSCRPHFLTIINFKTL